MALKVTNLTELSLPGGIGKHMPIFAGKTLIKAEADGVRISVINTRDLNNVNKATWLLGHERPVSCLSISPNGSFTLCSCSEDRVILWNLFPFKYSTKSEMPFMNTGVVVGENIGNVQCCSFSWSLKWLVLCLEKELWILLLTESIFTSNNENGFNLHKILSIDSKHIDMCSFSSQYPDIFVTVEDSNHFKVWNIASCEVIYRSTTVINDFIQCCSFSGMPNKLMIGTSKGVARLYHVNEKFIPSSFFTLNLTEENFLQSSVHDCDAGLNCQNPESLEKVDEYSLLKKACAIFSMKIYNREHHSNECYSSYPQDDMQLVAEKMMDSIICPGSILFMCCSLGVILFDCKSCEKICSISFLGFEMAKAFPKAQLSSIDSVIHSGESLDDIECWVKTCPLRPKLYHMKFVLEESPLRNTYSGEVENHSSADQEDTFEESVLTVLPSEPIFKNSPLLYCMKPGCKSLHALGQTEVPKKNDKVKSSGYGTTPRKKMFVPLTNESKKQTKPTKSKPNISCHHKEQCCNEGSALKYGPPEKLVNDLQMCETTGTCIKLAFSVNGRQIACNSAPTELCILPANAKCMEKSIVIPGHNSSITSLGFNLNSKWLISSSTDSTVKIWNWRNRQCILNINFEPKIANKYNHVVNPVTQAGFFYLDKFVVAASKGQMYLYSYVLNESPSIHSWSQQGSSHKIKTINFQTQQVNCFSAANQFHTFAAWKKDFILAGCSNRNIMVYDLNHQKMAMVLEDAHVHNSPHCLVQQTGSVCPSVPALSPEAYNLFLSAAMSDGVKLWDLRTARCIQKYNQHINRMYSLGMDFSPCSRFVAVCSEDKKVYLYDTRNCENYLAHLKSFSDIPMSVAFSPCMTQSVVSTLNGHLFTFTHIVLQSGNESKQIVNRVY